MAHERVAVVTGSSSGIGLLTAVELARNGYRVVATMRDLGRSAKLEETAQKAGLRDRLDLRRIDITETDSLAGAVSEIAREHGRIDVLVNNAGFSCAGFAEDITLAELRHQMETNFFGTVAMTKAALPIMRRQRSGHIVQLSSIEGRVATPLLSSYAASKFALEGWSEALRIELRALGIRVVLIEPGPYDTDIWQRNLVVGKQAVHPESPNKERSRRFADFVKSTASQRRDAREVAELIVRVANHPHPRLRYLLGPNVRSHVWFRALLPWKRYERAVAKVTRID